MGPTLPSASMVPVPAMNRPPVRSLVGELVDDPEGEHQPGRRTADALERDGRGERRHRPLHRTDPEKALLHHLGIAAQGDLLGHVLAIA